MLDRPCPYHCGYKTRLSSFGVTRLPDRCIGSDNYSLHGHVSYRRGTLGCGGLESSIRTLELSRRGLQTAFGPGDAGWIQNYNCFSGPC